ncbi:MAG TPA: AAA family ATPase, partial [Candidatus Saccharimonadales bacterium]
GPPCKEHLIFATGGVFCYSKYMIKPVIVYVSGAPGSGKTTLARLLADQLYIPSISSDLVHGGVAFLKPEHNRKQTLNDVFVPIMINMAQRGISFIVDQVLQKGSQKRILSIDCDHMQQLSIYIQCAKIPLIVTLLELKRVTCQV